MAKKTKKSENSRLLPGTLVMQKSTRQIGVIQYSYADEYGGNDYESLSIMWLKDGTQKGHCSAWHNASDFVEVPFEDMLNIFLKVTFAKLINE